MSVRCAGGRGGSGGSGAGSLGLEDQAFVREMAVAVNRAIAQDQEALNDLVLQVTAHNLYCR